MQRSGKKIVNFSTNLNLLSLERIYLYIILYTEEKIHSFLNFFAKNTAFFVFIFFF